MKTTKYVALLRGINVGGQKLIKMQELSRVLSTAGFHNVRTFIASGNVFFEAATKDPSRLARKIEKHVLQAFGHPVSVLIRTIDDIRKIVKRNPFQRANASGDVMQFVVFLSSEPSIRPKLPMRSETENFDVVALVEGAVFIVARRKKTGWFGFPNNFVEKHFGVTATTRNYSTLVKMVAAADSHDR